MIKIILADDHQLITDGLRAVIEQSGEYKVITSVQNGLELLKTLEVIEPDVVLMDIDMPVMNGIEAMQEIKRRYPTLNVIILTMHEEKALVKKFNNLGAKGFIFKNSSKEELLLAINCVYNGGYYYSAALTINLINTASNESSSYEPDSIKALLTDREIEILKLISDGLSNKEIGEKLFISHRTVDTHRTNLMKKLDVNNIAGLIRYAIKNGFIN